MLNTFPTWKYSGYILFTCPHFVDMETKAERDAKG